MSTDPAPRSILSCWLTQSPQNPPPSTGKVVKLPTLCECSPFAVSLPSIHSSSSWSIAPHHDRLRAAQFRPSLHLSRLAPRTFEPSPPRRSPHFLLGYMPWPHPAYSTPSKHALTFILSDVIPGGQVSAAALEELISGTSDTSFTWTVNLASGTSVTLKLTDSSGTIAYSSPNTIQAGSDTSCLNSTATSAAGAAGATGASGSAGASSSTSSTGSTDSSMSMTSSASASHTSAAATSAVSRSS